jgi:hypothetical protein
LYPLSSACKVKPSRLNFLTAAVRFFIGVLFDPEDGRDVFSRNFEFAPNCTELQPRKPYLVGTSDTTQTEGFGNRVQRGIFGSKREKVEKLT